MAGKKYRPALFELVGKGRLKPNKSGSLKTPEWFYTKDSATTPMRKEPKVVAGEELEFPVKPSSQPEDFDQPEEPRRENSFGLRLFDKKLAVWAPYWVIGLVALGLILSFLVAFWLGQSSVAAEKSGLIDTTVLDPGGSDSEAVTRAAEGGRLSSRTTENNERAPGDNQRAGMTNTGGTTESNDAAMAAGKGKNCLILSTLGNERDLRDLQGYFSSKGILTKIGRFGTSYVLYCDEGADDINSREAENFKQEMIKQGKGYNSERPRDAKSFLPETFDSLYWVLREKIRTY